MMANSADPSPVPTMGNNVFVGTSASDVLSGFDGNDSLSGGDGNDLFQEGLYTWKASKGHFVAGQSYDMGRGNDTFDGGTGYDLLSVSGTGAAAVLDLAAGTLTRGTQQDHFLNVELFELGTGSDLVSGAANTVYIDTGAGNDTITAFFSHSTLVGGAGSDVLDLRAETRVLTIALDGSTSSLGTEVTGFETVLGATRRATTFIGGAGAELLVGGDMADTLTGGGGNDTMRGANGRDIIFADEGNDLVYGGNGADTVTSANGVLTTHLGAGDDSVTGERGKVIAFMEAGNDHAFIADGTVWGGEGNDTLTADYITFQGGYYGGGAVALHGQDGADVLQVNGPDRATLDGGADNDTLVIANTHVKLTAFLSGGAGDDRFEILSGGGHAVLNGGDGNDTFVVSGSYMGLKINGGDGVSQLEAQSGRGFALDFQGGAEADTIHVTAAVGGSVASINASLLDGNDIMSAETGAAIGGTIDGGAGNDNLSGFTGGSLSGGEGDDLLAGFHLDNTEDAGHIFGGAGNDRIEFLGVVGIDGGDGDDLIVASQNTMYYGGFVYSDTGDIYGGVGNDTVEIGEGSFAIYTADVTPTLTLSRDVIGVETILFTGGTLNLDDFIGLDLTLGGGDDRLFGHVAGHVYHLGRGADHGNGIGACTIYGDDGNDWLECGGPGQVFYGGAGADIVIVHNLASGYGGAGDDIVETGLEPSVGMTLDGGGGNDWLNIYYGLGLVVRGGDGNDWARIGYSVTGSVNLGAGADTADLRDAQSVDVTLRVGAGSDTILAGASSADTVLVRDFDPGQDFLQLEGVTRLTDIDTVTQTEAGVTLVEGALTLELLDVAKAQLTDAVFLDYLV